MIPNNPNQYPQYPQYPQQNTQPPIHPSQAPQLHPQQQYAPPVSNYPYTPQRPPPIHPQQLPQSASRLAVPSPSKQAHRSPSSNFEVRIPSTPSKHRIHGAGGHGIGSPTTNPAHIQQQQQMLAQNSDKPNLMISLAESFFARAHALGVKLAQEGVEEKQYYKLVSTGLGLLETVLKKSGPPNQSWKLSPRLDCQVRLRYAHVLHEETENENKVEEVLNKGILIAQRNNLLDLKYAMQHLLVRVMFKQNTKASLALLHSITTDADQREAPYWQYAFRFLRSTLLLEESMYRDAAQAANILRTISNISYRRQDWQIFIFANILDATTSLQSGPNGLEAAAKALGRIQSLVSQVQVSIPVQLQFMYGVADVTTGIMSGNVPEAQKKLGPLHNILNQESFRGWKSWIELHINPSKPGRNPEFLKVNWLSKADTMLVGYFLSGIAGIPVSSTEHHKPEKFVLEGLKKVELMLNSHVEGESLSVTDATGKYIWRQTIQLLLEIYRCFLLVARTEWDEALDSLTKVDELVNNLPPALLPSTLVETVHLLRGTVYQSTAALEAALQHYAKLYQPLLHSATPHPPEPSEATLLGTINAVLLLYGPNPATHNQQLGSHLLAALEPHIGPTKNAALEAAYLVALSTTTSELLRSKKLLSQTLQTANKIGLKQPVYIILAFMSHRFFASIVSEQAEKSARAAWVNARKGKDSLWSAVGGEMLADCLGRKGEIERAAEQRRGEAESWAKVEANLGRWEREREGYTDDEEDAEGEVDEG